VHVYTLIRIVDFTKVSDTVSRLCRFYADLTAASIFAMSSRSAV
jgi:hypothetical protein